MRFSASLNYSRIVSKYSAIFKPYFRGPIADPIPDFNINDACRTGLSAPKIFDLLVASDLLERILDNNLDSVGLT